LPFELIENFRGFPAIRKVSKYHIVSHFMGP
jgi:hypothetical protein